MTRQPSGVQPRGNVAVSEENKLRFLTRELGSLRQVETHTAYVFLTRTRAYKIKKPVRLAYLDFGRLEAREHVCREEIRLNRQLAGDVYVGLIALVLRADGSLGLGGEGTIIDWLVEMKRLPESRMLDVRLHRASRVTRAQIAAVSDVLVGFYRARQAEPSEKGVYLHHLMQEAAVNKAHLRQMRAYLGEAFQPDLARTVEQLIARHRDEIARREDAHLIIAGHGDLRPEHVCLLSPPVIFDRIEFSPELSVIDIFDETNYLGLECGMLGAPWIGPAVMGAMQAAGFAPPSPELQATYSLFRLLTRARLSIDHLRYPDPRTPDKWPRQAKACLMRAAQVLDAMPSA